VDREDVMPLLYERYWGAPPVRGLVGGGNGWTLHGILLTRTDIPMTSFRCPADRRDYELTEARFYNLGPSIGWQQIKFDYAANAVGHGMTTRRLPWSLPLTSPNPGLDLRHSQIPNPSSMFMIWDGDISIWTITGGWAQLRNWVTPGTTQLIPEGTPHFDSTYRHSVLTKLDDGTLAKVGTKGPNALLADGHVEQKINLAGGPWSDDNFNIAGN